MHVDYTTEKAVADFLIAKYGKDRVIKRVFTTGEAGSKMQLMKIGRITYANPRHTWPRVNDIKDPTKKELVTSLLKQIVSEGFEMGSNNNIIILDGKLINSVGVMYDQVIFVPL